MPRLLIVEDETVVAFDLQETLEKLGYKVIASVTSGAEAIQILSAIQIDLVLMDIVLEDEMDGIAAAQQIRDRFNIPVIYLTAHADEYTLQRAINTNPYGYLIKPFQERDLHTAIEIALSRHKREKYSAQGQKLVERLGNSISQSFELDSIFNTTVNEVRQLFEIDRVIIYRFNWDKTGSVVVESLTEGLTPMLGWEGYDPWIAEPNDLDIDQHNQIRAIADIQTITKDSKQRQFLEFFGIRSELAIPLVRKEKLWGLFICYDRTAPHQWQQWQIELLEQVAIQLSIAMHQTGLFEELQLVNQKLQNLAAIDPLTQLTSRTCFDECLEEEWKKLASEQVPLCLILADIDFFKSFNDTYGRQAGDNCLQHVTSAICQSIYRPTHLVARYGGEEFVVMLPRTNANAGVWIAQKMRGIIKRLKIDHVKSPVNRYVTLSFGVASTIPHLKSSPRILVAAADQALYQAKAEGRDRVVAGRNLSLG